MRSLDRDAIISSIGDLSVTPRIIRHLSVFLHDPNLNISPAMEAIKAEPVLTGAMLSAVNAPAYFRGSRLLNLEDAVMRLGFRETYRIALLITFRQGLRIPDLPDNPSADFLWGRAVTTACAMEVQASSVDEGSVGYTIGLLHLIGCLILARNHVTGGRWDCTHPANLARAQHAAAGIAFPEAGSIALQFWGFPAVIWAPIQHQLHPEKAGDHMHHAVMLARATAMARLIEEDRPDSPAHQPDRAASRPPDPLLHRVEAESHRLMETFYPAPPAGLFGLSFRARATRLSVSRKPRPRAAGPFRRPRCAPSPVCTNVRWLWACAAESRNRSTPLQIDAGIHLPIRSCP